MRVAIVGAGVSGLSALWLLNEYSEHEVNIYEKNDYPGGHTHTVEFHREGKKSCMVDTGFIVLNPHTYPNFLRFLRHLHIPLLPTEMTFSISRDQGAFEWCGEGLSGVFCQLGNVFNPRLYRMVWDVVRFNLFALDLLRESEGKGGREISIGEYLDKEGYSQAFKDDYLLPMTAAIWSTPEDKCALDFPAITLIRFFWNHHLLQITGKPKWLTVNGGAKKYVDAILSKLPEENLHLNTEIVAISTHDGGVTLEEASGTKHGYDHVILATHADTTLEMLRRGGGISTAEEKALIPSQWSKNEAVLHWDDKFIPIRKKAYSAWNYLTSSSKEPLDTQTSSSTIDSVSLTYGMNILQHLPEEEHGPVLVTLNPPTPIDSTKIIGSWTYHHPMMTSSSISAQRLLPSIQNQRGISFVGAWTNYGFHEDGFASGMKLVTEAPFNVDPPFPYLPTKRGIPAVSTEEKLARVAVRLVQVARRWWGTTVIWGWVAWGIVLVLALGQRLAAQLKAKRVKDEVNRIRKYWIGEVSQSERIKKVQ